MEGYVQLRRGVLDHALAGKLPPFDFGLYVWLILRADYTSGIYEGCALTIACQFGNPSLKEHVQKALRRLRDRKYINYRNGDGSRGGYKILINRFDVMVGELSGTRLNAWKHGELVKAEYERQNGRGTVMAQSSNGRGTVMAPNKEKRIENVGKNVNPNCSKCQGKGFYALPAHPGMTKDCWCLKAATA